MNFLRKLLKKARSDRGDSILVPALILSVVVALVIGLAVEVGKNSYIRSDRINAIQDSASAAITLTDSRGSLNWSVVDKVVNEYEHNRFGKRVYSSKANTSIQYDDFFIRETSESQVFKDQGRCGEDNGQKYPYYKITLDTTRGADSSANSKSVTFARTQPSIAQLNHMAPLKAKSVYRSITVQVVDQAPNIMLSMAGMPCQKFDLNASAITFSANADVK